MKTKDMTYTFILFPNVFVLLKETEKKVTDRARMYTGVDSWTLKDNNTVLSWPSSSVSFIQVAFAYI